MNRHQRRAQASIIRRITRGVARVERQRFDGPMAEQARIHVASLWKCYAKVTGDVSLRRLLRMYYKDFDRVHEASIRASPLLTIFKTVA